MKDFQDIRFSLDCHIQLDTRRAQEDPVWTILAGRCQSAEQLVSAYLAYHIERCAVLDNMPATNGPADIYGYRIETVPGDAEVTNG